MPVEVGTKTFQSLSSCEKYTRAILSELGITPSVKAKSQPYFDFLLSLCKRHPAHLEKLAKFADFNITPDASGRGLALFILNDDNTTTEISWKICVRGNGPTPKASFSAALRDCVADQIKDFKKASDLSVCRICNCELHDKFIHIDHVVFFCDLVDAWLKGNEIVMPTDYKKRPHTFQKCFKDEDGWIGASFAAFHQEHATLRVLCEGCNTSRRRVDP
jgi:hypothetical protein